MLALVLCAIATVLSLLMLPRMKGLMVGYQWAKEMHGFDRSRARLPETSEPLGPFLTASIAVNGGVKLGHGSGGIIPLRAE